MSVHPPITSEKPTCCEGGFEVLQGDIPEELNRNLPQVLAEVIQHVNEYEVAALGAVLTSTLAWRSRSV
jgi:hypothetical protein